MFTLIAENYRGERIQLTNNPKYRLYEVDGLYPPNANISTATNATFDGSVFKSSRVTDRNIVLKVAIESPAEPNRLELYRYFQTKKAVKLYITNGTRDVFIDGYVETFEVGIWGAKQAAQISILCPKSYFSAADESTTDMSAVVGLFEFPFESEIGEGFEFSELLLEQEKNIYNSGEVTTGMIIEFRAHGNVSNPTFYNVTTTENIKVNISLQDGDVLTINTNKGEKSISLLRSGVVSNKLNNLDMASEWLQLESGDNIFLYTASSGAQYCECFVYFNVLYEGV